MAKMGLNASKRDVRFNSFELSDNEQQNPSNLKNVVLELQAFFPSKAEEFTEIDRLIDNSRPVQNDDDEDFPAEIQLYKEKFVATVRKDMRCLEILKGIRSLMTDTKRSDEVTNWDLLVKEGFKVQCYQSFIYTLMRLIDLNPSDKINRELSFNAGRTYICLLGLPGAKRCLIFEGELVTLFFKLFLFNHQLTNNLGFSDYDDHYLEIQILQMLTECKTAFNVVCLSDQEEVLEKYIEALGASLEHFMTSSRDSSHEIIMKCYDNLEALCLKPLPDKEIENIMYLIFCRTIDLHFMSQKRGSRFTNGAKHGETISDFFIYLLSNYSEKTKNVLLKFIKSLLSNPDLKFEREKFQKLLDVAVKYELALFWKVNESLISYLDTLSLASDHRQRLNGVDFCGKMLLIDTTPDKVQENLMQQTPREASVIKILFEKVYDKHDTVKLKALNSLKAAIINGNEYSKKVFNAVFKPKTASENPEIMQVVGKEAEKFQNNLLSLLQSSPSTYIRKCCLEILCQNCENLLNNEIFIDTVKSMTDDGSYLVKVQLLELVNSLLVHHSTTKNVLELWIDVVLTLIRDNETKIVEAAIKVTTAIFQKIESFENTVNDQQLLPWKIIRLIMSKGKRNLLQSAMSAVATNFLSQDRLRKIETHIFSSNKSEAWCILSIIAKKMKSNNPDIVVKTFLDHITHYSDSSFDTSDFHLIIEVIQSWTDSFNHSSQTQIAAKLSRELEAGCCSLTMAHHLYEICTTTRTILYGKDDTANFVKRLNNTSKKYIIDNTENFIRVTNDEKLLCYMLLYCEANTDSPERPDRNVVDFSLNIIKQVLQDKLKVSIELDVPRKLNVCIIFLTRFAVRDHELAAELTPDLAMLLRKKTLHISVIKTTMQCLNDLCKKHTSTVAPVFKEIIYKLHSPNEEIRLCALSNIYDLVMQDFIKMKGRVLLNFLACLVDRNELIQLKSQAAILSYINDKNQNLLYTCFLESVFLFNDFIQTENFGVFPLDEIDQNYKLLYGPGNRDSRIELYFFFVQNIHDLNEVHLLMLLKQVNIIKEKLEKKKFKKNSNGVDLLKDLLLIFKMVCDKRGESKMTISKGGAAEYADHNEDDEMVQSSSVAQPKGGGGRKNKNVMSINDAVPVIEKMISVYPAFVSLLIEYDESLESSIDDLTKSIVQNFPTFLEFSKPESFWHQAQKPAKVTSKRQKGKKRSAAILENSSDDDD